MLLPTDVVGTDGPALGTEQQEVLKITIMVQGMNRYACDRFALRGMESPRGFLPTAVRSGNRAVRNGRRLWRLSSMDLRIGLGIGRF